MGKGGTSRSKTKQQEFSLEKKDDDVLLPTELMHRIQSLLSEKEAGRTCVLSKSWLHAWSTISSLRFPDDHPVTTDVIYNTIQRRGKIPIEALNFCIKAEKQKLDEIQMRRILGPKTRRCLKELSYSIWSDYSKYSTFTFSSDELFFSGKKLQTIKLKATGGLSRINLLIDPVIGCVSLRVLELTKVKKISEDVFNNLLSTGSLLEKLILCFSDYGLKRIKVKNLGCLRQLEITSSREREDGLLDIDNVPSLGFLYYRRCCIRHLRFKLTDATASSLGRSLTQLHLEQTIIDEAFFNMINTKFPFLESLELRIEWALERLPTLMFPIIAPKEIKLSFGICYIVPLDASFYLKLWEALNNFSESKFDIHITIFSSHRDRFLRVSMNDDDVVDDLRRQVFNTYISHRTVSGMMENNTADLKQVLIINPVSGRWEALTSSRKTDFLDSLLDAEDVEFKLNWFSHD